MEDGGDFMRVCTYFFAVLTLVDGLFSGARKVLAQTLACPGSMSTRRCGPRGIHTAAASCLVLLLGVVLCAHAQTPGAPVPFVEYNAATSSAAATNGTILGPNYYFGT